MAFGDTLTPSAKLSLIKSTRLNWADTANGNFQLLDAIIGTYFTVNNLTGPWINSTVYVAGQAIVDTVASAIWVAAVSHTSSAPPTTFAQERTLHPTLWTAFSTAAHARGAWAPSTNYSVNDFVVSGSQYAVCIASHTSSPAFATDVALGRWSILVDLSAAGSLVLPILGGLPDANKVVVTNGVGTAYGIIAVMSMLGNGGATSIGLNLLTAANSAAVRAQAGLGTAAVLDAGTAAGNLVQMGAGPKLPAIDGSQLTGFQKYLQTVISSSSSMASGTNICPFDNTIPQLLEGTLFLAAVITPQNSGSVLEIDWRITIGNSVGPQQMTTHLHQDATLNAFFATSQYTTAAGGQTIELVGSCVVAAGSTTGRTYSLVIGPNNASTLAMNSLDAANPIFGGTCVSFIRVRERLP